MKRYAILFLMMAALTSACSTRLHRNTDSLVPAAELSVIDSLLWTQPDSAFAQLQGFAGSHEVDSLDLFNRHYFHLLLSELLYKNDYAQTNRDKLLCAVDYYDSLVAEGGSHVDADLLFLDARAHYIDGVGYYEMDSVVPACGQYLKAVELMEEHFIEEELVGKKAQFMALAYTRLTDVFSDHYLHAIAIYFAKRSVSYYQAYEAETWHLAWALEEIGAHYDMMQLFDSAEYYYDCSMNLLIDTNTQLYRDVASRKAFLSYEIRRTINECLPYLFHIANLAEDDTEKAARYLSIGGIYYSEIMYDSARVYLESVFENAPDFESKVIASEWLLEIALSKGDTLGSEYYAEALSNHIILKDQEGLIYADLTSAFQQYQQNRASLRSQKTRKSMAFVLGTAILMAVVLAIVMRRHLKKQNDSIREQLDAERYAHEVFQASLSGRLKNSNKTLRSVTKQIEQSRVTIDVAESDNTDDYAAFMNSPVCKQILDLVNTNTFKTNINHRSYKEYAINREQLIVIRRVGNEYLSHFTATIKRKYPKLSISDIDFCYLYLLGLHEADISVLLQKSISAVYERSKKIKRVMGSDDGLYYFLSNMLRW